MRNNNLKCSHLISFFSGSIVRKFFSFYRKANVLFLAKKINSFSLKKYNLVFYKKIFSHTINKNHSWKVNPFFKRKKRNFSCCPCEKRFFVVIQKKKGNQTEIMNISKRIFSPYFNLEIKKTSFLEFSDFLVNLKFAFLKLPINFSGNFTSFLNFENHIETQEISLDEKVKNLFPRKPGESLDIFFTKDLKFSSVNINEKLVSSHFLLENFLFFSKIFYFLFSLKKKKN